MHAQKSFFRSNSFNTLTKRFDLESLAELDIKALNSLNSNQVLQ